MDNVDLEAQDHMSTLLAPPPENQPPTTSGQCAAPSQASAACWSNLANDAFSQCPECAGTRSTLPWVGRHSLELNGPEAPWATLS